MKQLTAQLSQSVLLFQLWPCVTSCDDLASTIVRQECDTYWPGGINADHETDPSKVFRYTELQVFSSSCFFFLLCRRSDVTGRWNKLCCMGTGGYILSFWCLSLQPQAQYIFHSAMAYWQPVPLQPALRTLIFLSVRGINNWSGVGEVSHIDSFSLK